MKPYFSFQWHITDSCDQRCKHCYIFSDKKNHHDETEFDDLKRILNNCIDFCNRHNRKPYFIITGGDPILHPNFWDLLEEINRKGIEFCILGNPFHLTTDVCSKLKKLQCDSYQLSIDGIEETHDWFRKPGSLKETLRAISLLKNNDIEVHIMTTVSNINKDQILDIIDIVDKNEVDLFSFGRYCPSNSSDSNELKPLEYKNLLKQVKDKFDNEVMFTQLSQKDHLWTLYNFEEGNFKIPNNAYPDLIYDGCNCGNSHLTILPNGDILACRRVNNSKVGNILSDNLDKIWFEEMERYRDFNAFKKCSKCELLAWCRGCPAVASAQENGFYSEDPQCWKIINY